MLMESVLLYPRAAFHLGERGIGLEETSLVLHSDTLYSALCTAWATLYGEKGEGGLTSRLLPPKEQADDWRPPFLLSSAFPFAGSVRFYPKPFLPRPPEEEPEADKAKLHQRARLKDVEFVSESVFISLLSGERPSFSSDDELPHDGALWVNAKEAEQLCKDFGVRSLAKERFWSVMKAPRVVLDVQSSASNIWHFGRVVFQNAGNGNPKARAGYHFLVSYIDESIAERFRAAVHLLGDVGIGGDRSSGHGLFEPHFTPLPAFTQLSDASAFITLSLTFPKPKEVTVLLGESCRYRWVTRGGWIGGVLPTPLRRKTVRMLAEGSLLTGSPEQLVWGKILDLTPEDASMLGLSHRVYRYGFAFPVGVRL